MRKLKRWLIFLSTATIALGVLLFVLKFIFMQFFVDLWWFRSIDYEGYFLMRMGYRYLIFAGVVLVFFLIFFCNFWMASRYLGGTSGSSGSEETSKSNKYGSLVRRFRNGSMKIYMPLSFIMAIPIAIPLYERWEEALLFFFSTGSGVKDPTLGKDISYYLFSYPIFTQIQNELLIVFSSLFGFILLLYFIEKRVLAKESKTLPGGVKVHLTILIAFIILIQAWGFFLQRYELLYTDTHQSIFFGPGFLEMKYFLPLIWVIFILFILTGISLIVTIFTKKGLKALILTGVVFLLAIGLQQTTFLPELITKFIVKPNERNREKPYIENSIEATLAAYNIDRVKMLDYDIRKTTDRIDEPEVRENIRNIPVWDRDLLDNVYTQLQGIRSYYSFPNVGVDRYEVGGLYQQVYLAARELNLAKIPTGAKNWENTHMQYSHGYGVVMTPAAQGGKEPFTWFIRSLQPKSDYGFTVERPEIYFGLENYSFIIVPNQMGEIGNSDEESEEEPDAFQNYQGKGGVPMSSISRKLLFALYFKDNNIFFTPNTMKESRILFHRNIPKRIQKVTPFLLLDESPYVVVTPKGLFWMLDAYTISDKYPNTVYTAAPKTALNATGMRKFNYIRNSVKIVVDAYSGAINYYVSDLEDPIIQAYKRVYPSLLKDLSQMPPELKKHIRYPKYIFETQMKVYAKYHQTEPELFYQQEDTWQFANINSVPMRPYYLTTRLPESKGLEFLLVSPMSPVGRTNLRSLAVAGCDGENYGKVFIYSFPKGRQVDGPSQISALIDQDPVISHQLNLWDQRGSQVRRGRMILLPIGNSILYIQPVYLSSAAGTKIPELVRIIVSQGEVVSMEMSLEEALENLQRKLDERFERIKKRYPVPEPQISSDTKPEVEPETGLEIKPEVPGVPETQDVPEAQDIPEVQDVPIEEDGKKSNGPLVDKPLPSEGMEEKSKENEPKENEEDQFMNKITETPPAQEEKKNDESGAEKPEVKTPQDIEITPKKEHADVI